MGGVFAFCKESQEILNDNNTIYPSTPGIINNIIEGYNYNQNNTFLFDDIAFDSKFECGNLMLVEKISSDKYNIWISSDCSKTPYQSTHAIWFYFKVNNADIKVNEIKTLYFTIKNMNLSYKKILKDGIRPVYMSSANKSWKYINNPITEISQDSTNLEFTFKFDFSYENKEVYFAQTFPYTFIRLQNLLDTYERQLKFDKNIYFHREILINSLERKPIDMLTITSFNFPMTDNQTIYTEELIPNLFPKCQSQVTPPTFQTRHNYRPIRFQKRYILISARSCPGEIPSSFILEGLLKCLLDQKNPISKVLLHNFVFVIIPMINPDGVCRGNYKMDTIGQDLSKLFHIAKPDMQPGPFGLMSVANYLAKDGRLFMFLDLRTQIQEESSFLLANYWNPIEAKLEIRLFARLLDIYSKYFDYENCSFGIKPITDKPEPNNRGSARIEIRNSTDLVHCYTIETSYQRGNKDPNRYKKDSQEAIIPENNGIMNKQFDPMLPEDYEEIGSSIQDAILELVELHPSSLIKDTIFKNIDNVKKFVVEKLTLSRKKTTNNNGNGNNNNGSVIKSQKSSFGEISDE